jgi:hypothetical protein
MRYAVCLLLLSTFAACAQEGHAGVGHEQWHQQFYMGLVRPGNGGSCCNLTDCRPTAGKAVGDHYEIKINGKWTRVLDSKIIHKSAPDQGFHVCAPYNWDGSPEGVYCVILPPET